MSKQLRNDEFAVSEVVGHVITFGIMALMLTGALVGFGIAKQNAETEAAQLHGSALLSELARNIADIVLYVDAHASSQLNLSIAIDLPETIVGYQYELALNPTSIQLSLVDLDLQLQHPIHNLASDLTICSQDDVGQATGLGIRSSVPPGITCAAGKSNHLFLESA